MERPDPGAPFLCRAASDRPETCPNGHKVVASSDSTLLESPHSRDFFSRTGCHPTSEEPMRFRATLMLGALLVVASAGSVFGQGFQGGLRGSIKDAGGVIPGVEVTLTN